MSTLVIPRYFTIIHLQKWVKFLLFLWIQTEVHCRDTKISRVLRVRTLMQKQVQMRGQLSNKAQLSIHYVLTFLYHFQIHFYPADDIPVMQSSGYFVSPGSHVLFNLQYTNVRKFFF